MSLRDAKLEDAARQNNFLMNLRRQEEINAAANNQQVETASHADYPDHPKHPSEFFPVLDTPRVLSNYNDKRFSHEDEMTLGEYFFNSGFDYDYISSVKDDIKNKRGIVLDNANVFEIALLYALDSSKYEQGMPKELEKLYGYLEKDAETCILSMFADKREVYGETVYSAALNVVKEKQFDLPEQFLEGIFSDMKNRGIVSKTFNETAKSKILLRSLDDRLNPAAFVYTAVLDAEFEPDVLYNASKWYSRCVGQEFSRGLRGSLIECDEVTYSIIGKLKNIEESCKEGSFDYIKYVNKLKFAKQFLEKMDFEGFVSIDGINKIYFVDSADGIPERITGAYKVYAKVNMKRLLEPIKQQVYKYDENLMNDFLDALEFLYHDGFKLPKNQIKDILEKYMDQKHPMQTARKNQKNTRRRFNRHETREDEFNNRTRWLYRDLGGDLNNFGTPADVYRAELENQAAEARERAKIIPDTHKEIEIPEPEPEYKHNGSDRGFEVGQEVVFIASWIKKRTKTTFVCGGVESGGFGKVEVSDIPDASKGKRYAGVVQKIKGTHLIIDPATVKETQKAQLR